MDPDDLTDRMTLSITIFHSNREGVQMGEIADDVIEGECCANCMTYFEKGHGYMVLCHRCWNNLSKTENGRRDYQKAIQPPLTRKDSKVVGG